MDAICLEDGLDGLAGERVLQIIRGVLNAAESDTLTAPPVVLPPHHEDDEKELSDLAADHAAHVRAASESLEHALRTVAVVAYEYRHADAATNDVGLMEERRQFNARIQQLEQERAAADAGRPQPDWMALAEAMRAERDADPPLEPYVYVRVSCLIHWIEQVEAGAAAARRSAPLPLTDALKAVGIGGNHLASALITAGCHPSQCREWSYDAVLERWGQPIADMWVAWKAIMDLRDAREAATPNPA